MNATVARLTVSSLLGRRRALLLLALPLILLALAITFRAIQGERSETGANLLGAFSIGLMVPLLGLIAGTGAIAPEIDDGSIVYLLAKPLTRGSIVRSKLLVAVAVVTGFGALPTLLAGVITSGTADGVALGFAVGALVAGIAYSALFLVLAVLTRNAVVAGLFYALVWESVVGGFVPGAQALSIQQWALSFTRAVIGDPAAQLGVTSAVGLTMGATLLIVVTLACTWYAGRALRNIRLTSDE